MKKLLLALLSLAAVTTAQAQQQPQFTHYGQNGLYLNPAYAGITSQAELTLIGRYQYLSLGNTTGDANGSPRTGMVSAAVPVRPLNGGLGLVVYYDQAAVTKLTSASLAYSQHVKLGQGQLGIGVEGTFTYLDQGEYRSRQLNDPMVPGGAADHKFDAGAGLWYESPKFYAGLSANNLFRSVYTLQSPRYDAAGNLVGHLNTSRFLGENHAYFTAGYRIAAANSVTITPTVLAKAVLPGSYDAASKFSSFNNYSLEGGVQATISDQFLVGVNYRQQESLAGLLGYAFGAANRYRFSYAFDFVAFSQDARAFGSHELLLQLRLPKAARPTRPAVHTPRYGF